MVRYSATVAFLLALTSITRAAETIEIKIGYLRAFESKAAISLLDVPPDNDGIAGAFHRRKASCIRSPARRVLEGSPLLYYVCLLNPFTHAVEVIRFSLYGKLDLLSLAVVCGCTAVS